METIMFAGVLLHPIALVILVAIVLVATTASYSAIPEAQRIPLRRLLGGYLGALLVVIVMSAVISYVSPEEAQKTYKIPAEKYWSALWHTFLPLLVMFAYLAILGIAVLGVPTILYLKSRHCGTVPWILLAATIISIAAALLLQIFVGSRSLLETVGYLAGAHLLLAIGFCLGARVPWKADGVSA